jgi:hypothetical protein
MHDTLLALQHVQIGRLAKLGRAIKSTSYRLILGR